LDFVFAFGYSKFGFSRNLQIGLLGAAGYTLWLVWERYTTYVEIQDKRWLINAEQRLFPEIKIDIASVLYIARAPHAGKIRQTSLPETLYSWATLSEIVKKLVSLKPTIELDPQYWRLISEKDSRGTDLSDKLPRSVEDIEAYVASHYGPP
jgi:hypothetical protein